MCVIGDCMTIIRQTASQRIVVVCDYTCNFELF